MKIGVIGDDFTGSGDIANTLAKAGARTVQYVGIPDRPLSDETIDAAVVALKTRSIAADRGRASQSLAACRWLVENGAEQIVFKYCSTFNSTPQGNIGPVAEALLRELGAPLALVCPAFPANGRTLYQGHLFVGDRLLNESGMEKHPLTPMTDPDIRRWLSRQTRLKVGHLPLETLRAGSAEAALRLAERNGDRLIVADAITDADLLALGALARSHRLVTGGSGIAMGLPGNFGIRPSDEGRRSFAAVSGPAIVLSGSCSAATRRQIDVYRNGHPSLRLDAGDVARCGRRGEDAASIFSRRIAMRRRWSIPRPSPPRFRQRRTNMAASVLATLFETVFAELALKAVDAGFPAAGGGGRRDVRRRRFGLRSARAGGRAGDRYWRAGADPRWRAASGLCAQVGQFRRR